jgi:ADP-ribose pyrophosphatase
VSEARRLGSRTIHRGRAVQLDVDRIRLPNGREMDFELVHHPGAAAVLPMLDDATVLLIRQYRYATGGWLLEIPAGTLDPGESPERCAFRETAEETGYQAGRLEPLGWIWTSPGVLDEKIWLYLARDLAPARQDLQHDEILTVVPMPLAEAVDKARRGEIHDAKSVCALLRAWAQG